MNEEWFLDYLFLKPMIFFWDLATINIIILYTLYKITFLVLKKLPILKGNRYEMLKYRM